MPKPVAAIFTTSEGHLSLAQAAQEALAKEWKVVILQVPLPFNTGYTFIYRHWPQVFKPFYSLAKLQTLIKAAQLNFDSDHADNVHAFIAEHQPELFISTYFFFPRLLIQYQRPTVNIVSNPRSLHPIEITDPPSVNWVFDHYQAQRAREFIMNADTEIGGWLVRAAFKPVTSTQKKQLRQSLHLEPDLPVITLVTGSEGNMKALDFLEAFISTHPEPIQLVLMTGHNRKLLREAQEFQETVPKHVTLHVQGFTNQAAAFFQAADLVVGKAGPNNLFEAGACQVPFFAISHISGQEDGNLDLIRQYQLGWVNERIALAAQQVSNLIVEKQELKQVTTNLAQAAHFFKGLPNLTKYCRQFLP